MDQQQEIVVRNPQIFSGYNHIGSCREFAWYPRNGNGSHRFFIRNLRCAASIESLSLNSDLYLCATSGEEFVVKEFQLSNAADPEELSGSAARIEPLADAFPELRTALPMKGGMIAKDTHITAIRAVASMVNAVKEDGRIETQETLDASGRLVADVARTPDAVINLMAVKSYDDYIYAHTINVATLAINIGFAMGLPRDDLHVLGIGALLHDVGKLRIALTILNKEGPLDGAETDRVRQHPQIGFDLLTSSKEIPAPARMIILQHHERFNGGGYPRGLHGDACSILSRIVSIADVYDALTSRRPFRPAVSPYESMRILLSNAENQFDPAVLGFFVRRMSLFPPGSLVRLNNGIVAMVLRPNPDAHMRPIVRFIRDASGVFLNDETEHDLMVKGSPFVQGPSDNVRPPRH